MIRAVYDRPHRRVTVTGHAGAAPHGEDLVCAAVSALLCTLAEALRRLEENGQAEQVVICLQSGCGEVSFGGERDGRATTVTDAVCAGLECLAQAYPRYVAYEG